MIHAKYYLFPVLLGVMLIAAAGTLTAQEGGTGVAPPGSQVVTPAAEFSVLNDLARPILLAILWTVLGIALFAGCIRLMVALSPFSVQKEIEEDQNTALGIIMGAMILGISIILAAAILG